VRFLLRDQAYFFCLSACTPNLTRRAMRSFLVELDDLLGEPDGFLDVALRKAP
jgi:hypothetical protein